MGDGDAECECGGRGCEHLIAVGDEQQNVWPPIGERIGKTENRNADGLCHACVGVGVEKAFDAGLDGESIVLDCGYGAAEMRRKMGAEDEDSKLDFRTAGQFTQRPVEMAVVGA